MKTFIMLTFFLCCLSAFANPIRGAQKLRLECSAYVKSLQEPVAEQSGESLTLKFMASNSSTGLNGLETYDVKVNLTPDTESGVELEFYLNKRKIIRVDGVLEELGECRLEDDICQDNETMLYGLDFFYKVPTECTVFIAR